MRSVVIVYGISKQENTTGVIERDVAFLGASYFRVRAARPSGIRSFNAWTPHHTCPINTAFPTLLHSAYFNHSIFCLYTVFTVTQ